MIIIAKDEHRAKLDGAAPQTVLTLVTDIKPPKGSYIVNLMLDRSLWKVALFERSRQLGKSYPVTYPYTYPLYYIMREEMNLKGAEAW